MRLRRGRLALPQAGERARAEPSEPRFRTRTALRARGRGGGTGRGGRARRPPAQAGPWPRAGGRPSRRPSSATTWWRGPSTASPASRRRTSGGRRCRPRSASGRRRPAGGSGRREGAGGRRRARSAGAHKLHPPGLECLARQTEQTHPCSSAYRSCPRGASPGSELWTPVRAPSLSGRQDSDSHWP